MDATQVTLHEGQDSWYAQELLKALQKAGLAADRTELEGGLFRVCVAQADVARAAAVMSSLGNVGKPWSKGQVWLLGLGVLVPSAALAFLGQALSPVPNTSALFGLGLLCWGAASAFDKLSQPRTNVFAPLAWACVVVTVAASNWSGYVGQLSPLLKVLVGVILFGVAPAGAGAHHRRLRRRRPRAGPLLARHQRSHRHRAHAHRPRRGLREGGPLLLACPTQRCGALRPHAHRDGRQELPPHAR